MYALKLCPDSAITPIGCSDEATGNTPGLQLAAWNNMDVYFSATPQLSTPNPSDPSTTCTTQASPTTPYTCLDVACLPTSYAGRTLSVQLFDPGDGYGDIYVGIAQAGVGTADVSYPGLPATYITTIDGDTVVHARFHSLAFLQRLQRCLAHGFGDLTGELHRRLLGRNLQYRLVADDIRQRQRRAGRRRGYEALAYRQPGPPADPGVVKRLPTLSLAE